MKKEHLVASRLPQELVRDLELIERVEQTDRSTAVRKLLSRAISEAGVSLWEMMDYARQRKIAAQYDLEDLRKDVETVLSGSAAAQAQPGDE